MSQLREPSASDNFKGLRRRQRLAGQDGNRKQCGASRRGDRLQKANAAVRGVRIFFLRVELPEGGGEMCIRSAVAQSAIAQEVGGYESFACHSRVVISRAVGHFERANSIVGLVIIRDWICSLTGYSSLYSKREASAGLPAAAAEGREYNAAAGRRAKVIVE